MMATERPVTLPADFWDAMTLDEQREVAKLERDRGVMLLPSGSRYICPGHHRPDSDFDIYTEATERLAMGLILQGWKGPRGEGDDDNRDSSGGLKSMALKKGGLNLIVFFAKTEFSKFKDATDVCRDLCVTDRDERVKLFRKICER